MAFRLLQNREQRFYSGYLLKFEPMRIKTGTVFINKGSKAIEVFFVISGYVESEFGGKYYSKGQIFGESDIIYNRNRLDTFVAKIDCHILRLKKSYFEDIMDEFEDIKDDINKIAEAREQQRLKEIMEQEENAKYSKE